MKQIIEMPHVGSTTFYAVFFIVVTIMILIDMFSLKKTGIHKVSIKEALIWSLIWVLVTFCFAGWLYFELLSRPEFGQEIARQKILEFFTGYVLEKSLAVDNIFVFLMIFTYFKVPSEYQHRVLLYGVWGAIILRAVMIGVGVILVQEFAWILYVFGIFLLYSGVKLLFPSKEDIDFAQHPFLKWVIKVIPFSQSFAQEKFFTQENGKILATPLLLVLIMIEMSDVIFAVDSIPAIFAVTTDPFIILTSNIFAILGLRAMYFLLANASDRFVYLQYGLACVLVFIGVKMLVLEFIHIPISISLFIIFMTLGLSICASLFLKKEQ